MTLKFFIASVALMQAAAIVRAVETWPDEHLDMWHGYVRHNFTVDGCAAWVVEPKDAAAGNPWTWCMEFPDAFTERTGVLHLLERGFHHAYINVGNTFGCPAAVKHFDEFYKVLYAGGLAKKTVLIGISRGGLYCYNFAAEDPARVACVYGDGAVCDFKSWPAGKGKGIGSAGDWASLIKLYGFKDEAEALAYQRNPVDLLVPLAAAKVPMIHVVGDADKTVVPEENALVIEQRYKKLGGEIQVIHKANCDHHPHGLDNPQPIVDFVMEHTLGASALRSRTPVKETPEQRAERLRWFTEARFGMFIHWGVYSVPAGEWGGRKGCGEWLMQNAQIPASKYEEFARQFNPVKFDARQWVSIARNAGMKYIVITAKHHDGFGMFRSELTDWCIKSTPFQRDPLKELAGACQEAGIKLGFYYSIMDWHHPDWFERRPWNDRATGTPSMERYTEFMKGQLSELLTRYGPVAMLWFDGDTEQPWSHQRGVELYRYLRSLQPKLIVNNRIAKARDEHWTDEGSGDFGTPEQHIPAAGQTFAMPWESCMTINGHWGYDKSDQDWKPAGMLLRNLVDCASKGGNYLLNVGPTAEGLIPEASVKRLREVGEWMKTNGEAIYGTTAGNLEGLPSDCLATEKSGRVYITLLDWPDRILIPFPRHATRAFLLSDPARRSLAIKISDDHKLEIGLPKENPGRNGTVVCVELASGR